MSKHHGWFDPELAPELRTFRQHCFLIYSTSTNA